jgi:hypothetical protein
MVEVGGRRCLRTPRRRAHSPVGEHAAVERFSDGALGPVPRVAMRQGGSASMRLAVSVRAVHAKSIAGGDGGGDGEMGPSSRSPSFRPASLHLGLGLGFRFCICFFDSRSSSFLLPETRSTT